MEHLQRNSEPYTSLVPCPGPASGLSALTDTSWASVRPRLVDVIFLVGVLVFEEKKIGSSGGVWATRTGLISQGTTVRDLDGWEAWRCF